VAAVAALVAAAVLAGAAPSAGPWRAAPEYVALFAPAADRAAYDAYVTPRALDEVLRALGGDPRLVRAPGAWEARAVLPSDAFGQAGTYDRSRLAQLYGARRVRVARGPRKAGTAVTEAWLLVSPYPDPALGHLEAGTLLIVLHVPDL
jgi:hypothetical protein